MSFYKRDSGFIKIKEIIIFHNDMRISDYIANED